jgi:hypothetical protein
MNIFGKKDKRTAHTRPACPNRQASLAQRTPARSTGKPTGRWRVGAATTAAQYKEGRAGIANSIAFVVLNILKIG